ncbi:lytic polysaccharide monooxygenase [Legionella bononiensis]|uniref:Lytic polysaccharide monooxygenase n=1 Tax=Legionella bononiensis TaxID=2793102 RepID=A0ABS1WD64_9GAMM|nr:lytic polysaccharide monooxygenase [Legionella bononiensis]MBL7481197.1 lytic polysaccharide monooxygenase [Legionella bononiensis]MBL7527303.1 lytic polysaccharide monooxygenase [Legionella bononiensis]MBL7562272.1 lytic polysaccharide monooxygenase [Legionella bononiensis]
MFFNRFSILFIACFFMLFQQSTHSHGLIEQPGSREYFCGKVTQPHHIEPGNTIPFKECRPILTKEDGSYNQDVYQFMSVLSHTRGYYQNDTLPQHVCGFNNETFKGKASPWDAAINWPTNKIRTGEQEFVWDVSYGPHFSDTEHFRYWITKPDYQFKENQPLQWSDLETEPFCQFTWDDENPTQDKNTIWADKTNNKFHMTCQVPERSGRHVIYAEWGRNQSTNERFHSCIDVVY